MPDKKFYLTKEGLEKVKKEYERLVEFRKLKTKGDVPSLLESEDVNPEYLSFQEDMSFLDARLAEYENILKNVEFIKIPPKERKEVVCLGAKVVVKVDDGQIDEYEIVGTLEANPSLGKISDESPVGKAFLGQKIGAEVMVSSPKKTIYTIEKIRYATE